LILETTTVSSIALDSLRALFTISARAKLMFQVTKRADGYYKMENETKTIFENM